MNQTINFNQITLITDGCSNQGISPIEAARIAFKRDITINVIGITDGGTMGKKGEDEIENIASAGGGISQIVPIEQIARTVQMVTRQAMNKTIHQVIHTQLTNILGKDDLTSIPPTERIKVVQMMDNMSEYSNLKIILLVDQSASMRNKMKKVEEAILDFQLSLISRAGTSLISIVTFPGDLGVIDVKIPWTKEIGQISSLINRMIPKGNTPTGSALKASIECFTSQNKRRNGVLDEYII